MAEPFVGEIRMFAGPFAPRGWAICQGQIIGVSQNSTLFSILGTTYGGNGQTNFALPNLTGLVPLGFGNGAGLTPYALGDQYGVTSVTLNTTEMPAHSHGLNVSSANGTLAPGADAVLGRPVKGSIQSSTSALMYSTGSADVTMTTPVLGPAGGNGAHNNMMAYIVINYIIALSGIFPARG